MKRFKLGFRNRSVFEQLEICQRLAHGLGKLPKEQRAALAHIPLAASVTAAAAAHEAVGLAGLQQWLGTNHWDVIHFNWGLWDLCYRNPKSESQGHRDKVNGKLSTSLADYEQNLDALVQRLQKTGAVLIWASITAVPEGEAGRFVGDEVKYNAAAERVMKKHGVRINDLYATTKAFPPDMFKAPGDVHYTPEGSAKLADQVAARVSEGLKVVGKRKSR